MHMYEFLLELGVEPDLDTTERLYAYFSEQGAAAPEVRDFSLVTRAGSPAADCSVEARSFEAALNVVLPVLREEGIRVVRVEMDAQGLALLQE